MATTTYVLVGPARAGKTDRLLDHYRRLHAGTQLGQLPRGLWICPNRAAVADIRGRLLATDLDACFAPRVLTFDELATQLLKSAGDPLRPLGRSGQRFLLRELIESLRRQDELRHFQDIAKFPGTVALLQRTIVELKRREIWPEQLAGFCRQRGSADRDQDVVAIYTAYQQHLRAHSLFDSEGRLWRARSLLQQDTCPALTNLDLVVVAGFSDFTRTQHDILEQLCQRSSELHVSLTCDVARDEQGKARWAEGRAARGDLFAKPLATLAELQRRHHSVKVQLMPAPEPSRTIRDVLERQLFRSPGEHAPQTARIDDRQFEVGVIAAAEQAGECEEVARHIKHLLVSGQARPEQVCVVARDVDARAARIREVFDSYGIPCWIESHDTLSRAPTVRATLALLDLKLHDWPYRKLLSVISNRGLTALDDQSPPNGDRDSVLAAACRAGAATGRAAAEWIVGALQLPQGRSALLTQTHRWAERFQPEAAVSLSSTATRATAATVHAALAVLAERLLMVLSAALEALPHQAPAVEWSDAIANLVRDLGVQPGMPKASDRQRDRDAWQRLHASLLAVGEIPRADRQRPQSLTLAEVRELLEDITQHEAWPEQFGDTGRVRVLSAESARTLSCPHLIVIGLNEYVFPRRESSSKLYSEEELEQLVAFATQSQQRRVGSVRLQQSTEMLLFYELVTRSSESLTISYTALDAKAIAMSPSPYLQEVARALAPIGGYRRLVEPELPITGATRTPFCATEYRLNAVSEAVAGSADRLTALAANDDERFAAQAVLDGIEAIDARARGDSFGVREGVFQSPAVIRQLAATFSPHHLWSASQLERYATCPFRFYMGQVLGLRPPTDIAVRTDYRRRGILLHQTLTLFHQKLDRITTVDGEFPAEAILRDTLVEALAEAVEPLPRGGREGALVEIDRIQISTWLDHYPVQLQTYLHETRRLGGLRPAHFEVRFGPAQDDEGGHSDRLSTSDPFPIQLADAEIRLTGRIDRIDIGTLGEHTVFNIVDYKSSARVQLSAEEVESGRQIQLPLYALAVEELLLTNPPAQALQAGYWEVRNRGFSRNTSLSFRTREQDRTQLQPSWLELKEQMLARLQQIVDGIRGGAFPMINSDPGCTQRCEFAQVCRVAQTRSLAKTWPPPPEAAQADDENV